MILSRRITTLLCGCSTRCRMRRRRQQRTGSCRRRVARRSRGGNDPNLGGQRHHRVQRRRQGAAAHELLSTDRPHVRQRRHALRPGLEQPSRARSAHRRHVPHRHGERDPRRRPVRSFGPDATGDRGNQRSAQSSNRHAGVSGRNDPRDVLAQPQAAHMGSHDGNGSRAGRTRPRIRGRRIARRRADSLQSGDQQRARSRRQHIQSRSAQSAHSQDRSGRRDHHRRGIGRRRRRRGSVPRCRFRRRRSVPAHRAHEPAHGKQPTSGWLGGARRAGPPLFLGYDESSRSSRGLRARISSRPWSATAPPHSAATAEWAPARRSTIRATWKWVRTA